MRTSRSGSDLFPPLVDGKLIERERDAFRKWVLVNGPVAPMPSYLEGRLVWIEQHKGDCDVH